MAIVVTMRNGSKTRRYVVDSADEDIFEHVDLLNQLISLTEERPWEHPLHNQWFGGQWLRGPGRVDEMYRSLYGGEVVKIKKQKVNSDCNCGCGAGVHR